MNKRERTMRREFYNNMVKALGGDCTMPLASKNLMTIKLSEAQYFFKFHNFFDNAILIFFEEDNEKIKRYQDICKQLCEKVEKEANEQQLNEVLGTPYYLLYINEVMVMVQTSVASDILNHDAIDIFEKLWNFFSYVSN